MILDARKLAKSFRFPQRVDVITSVTLSIGRGESIAISGRSGSGKTTLLHLLGTLEEPDAGELYILGERCTPAKSPSLRAKSLGFVFQSYNLLEDFTALENVLMPARIAREPIDRSHGLDLLSQVGLDNKAAFPAKLLSGGERQRVAIARALCNDPDLILADEPSGNLDAANAKLIGDLLFSLVKDRKKSLILVTHDPQLASNCDQRYQLTDGHLAILPQS
jgi:lipoprotein-releasing system ATP-binding protein